MATEAQRLIGISLAKIAQSRCGRGGVSLHKNLLVATVLQKARFIFMEEAYHMVHGHYLQATNKFLEPEIDPAPSVEDDDLVDDTELDDIFNAPVSSIGKDEDSEEAACDKENNPPQPPTSPSSTGSSIDAGLTYFDLDINRIQQRSTEPVAASNKRRREISEHETEEAVLSILPKRIRAAEPVVSSSATTTISSSDTSDDSDTDSLFNEDDFAATSLSEHVAREFEELNNNNNSTSNNNNTTTTEEPIQTAAPAMEGIDRITSLVSIFSFGNLSRSVSTPDLCSAQAKDESPQRTYLAMTV